MATKNRTKGVPKKVVSQEATHELQAMRELRTKAKKRSSGRVRIPRSRPSSSVELDYFRRAKRQHDIKGLALLLAIGHTAAGTPVPATKDLVRTASTLWNNLETFLPDLEPPTKEEIRQARIEDAKKAREARKGKGA